MTGRLFSAIKKSLSFILNSRLLGSLLNCGIVFGVLILLCEFLYPRLYRIEGSSMLPVLEPGDCIIVTLCSESGAGFREGDLVLVLTDVGIVVKRLAAIGPCIFQVDNAESPENTWDTVNIGNAASTEYVIPEGMCFLLSVNPDVTFDSRSEVIGCIPISNILGVYLRKVPPVLYYLVQYGKDIISIVWQLMRNVFVECK